MAPKRPTAVQHNSVVLYPGVVIRNNGMVIIPSVPAHKTQTPPARLLNMTATHHRSVILQKRK